MKVVMKVGHKGQVVIPQDAVAIFRQTAKGMGKLRFHPHESYEEELEEKVNP